MKPRILLVNPPIYDFSAYDLWLKPPDGERCRSWIDMDEALRHNKTAFSIARLGASEINRLKTLAGGLNQRLGHRGAETSSTIRDGQRIGYG
jgi:hypothetical protein